ncbi:MAG: GIY-YIG nuclease family protein [Pseudomonadota bacterium]
MTKEFRPAVYFVANRKLGAISCGVTSNLAQRAWQHKEGTIEGFSKRYNCKLLVWFEFHATMEAAIEREKQLKAGSRNKKVALIVETNPDWFDLYPQLNQ